MQVSSAAMAIGGRRATDYRSNVICELQLEGSLRAARPGRIVVRGCRRVARRHVGLHGRIVWGPMCSQRDVVGHEVGWRLRNAPRRGLLPTSVDEVIDRRLGYAQSLCEPLPEPMVRLEAAEHVVHEGGGDAFTASPV